MSHDNWSKIDLMALKSCGDVEFVYFLFGVLNTPHFDTYDDSAFCSFASQIYLT